MKIDDKKIEYTISLLADRTCEECSFCHMIGSGGCGVSQPFCVNFKKIVKFSKPACEDFVGEKNE